MSSINLIYLLFNDASVFLGRDASRAFVSGDFSEEGLIDDITGLTSTDYIGLNDWVKFYDKDYRYVGK